MATSWPLRARAQQATPPNPDSGWRPLKIGAGGKVTSIDIAPDGNMVCRCDTYGAYWWNPVAPNPGNNSAAVPLGAWVPVITLGSMPVGDLTFGGGQWGIGVKSYGCMEIVIAPSITSRFYMHYSGRIYRSDNSGALWSRCAGWTQVLDGDKNPPQSNGHENGQRKSIAVDPANPDVVYASTIFNELRASVNGGASFSTVPTVGNAGLDVRGSGRYLGHAVAFDTSGGAQGSGKTLRTRNVYICTYGTGVFKSTDGGTTFLATSGGPTSHLSMVVASDGWVWLVDDTGNDNGPWVYNGANWTHISEGPYGGIAWNSIAVDPANPARIILGSNGGIDISLDHGATWNHSSRRWKPLGNRNLLAADIPWLGVTNEVGFMTAGNMQFDPSQVNTLLFAEGIGVWWCSPPNTDSALVWTSQSAGIEQLVGNFIICPPGGKPNLFFWDRPQFYSADQEIYPSDHGPNYKYSIIHGWVADWASADPSIIVAIMNHNGHEASGFSSDGGLHWSDFPTKPPTLGASDNGCIAAASSTNWLLVAGRTNDVPYYTLDAGVTWTPSNLPSGVNGGWSTWPAAGGTVQNVFAADRVLANTFYALNAGGVAGVYKSTDGGANFLRVHTGKLTNNDIGGGRLKCPPYLPKSGGVNTMGHVFWSPATGGQPLMRSIDGGAHWSAVQDFSFVGAYGFGAVAPRQAYPSVLVFGTRGPNQRSGLALWESVNNCLTWTNVTGNFFTGDVIIDIEGDKTVPNRWYLILGQSGAVYCAKAVATRLELHSSDPHR